MVSTGDNMLLLTLRDLQHRVTRLAVVTVLVSVVFALLFTMTGVAERFEREAFDTVGVMGNPVWLVPEGTASPFTSSGTVSINSFASTDGSPVVVARGAVRRADDPEISVVIVGVAGGGVGVPSVVEGITISGPGEVVVDKTVGVDIGDQVIVGGIDATVVGVSNKATIFAGTPMAFVELGESQQVVFGSTNLASAFLVARVPSSLPPGVDIRTSDDIAADALVRVESAVSSLVIMRALLWVVAAVVIGAMVFLSALERSRDFAVLRAMGSPTSSLAGGLAIQAALVALVGVTIAIGLQALLAPVFPLGVEVPARAFWQIPLVAVTLALLASLAGVRRVSKSDPAEAFGGPGG